MKIMTDETVLYKARLAIPGAADSAIARDEQVRLLFTEIPSVVAGNLLVALVVAFVQWSAVSTTTVLIWIVAMIFLQGVRAAQYVISRPQVEQKNNSLFWLWSFRSSTIMTGALWGLAAVFLFPANDVPHQAFLTVTLAGMSAGAATRLAVDLVSVLGYIFPAMVLLIIRLFVEGGDIPVAMGLLSILYLVFISTSAHRARNILYENMSLRVAHAVREQEFSSLLESSPDNIIRYDRDCRAIYVNHLMEETVDVDTSSLLGKTPMESRFDGLVGVENYQQKLQEVIAHGEPREMEVVARNPQGEVVTHHVCVVAERDNNGRVVGAIAFGRDVSAQKKAESELRIAAIAMGSQEAIAITDNQQRIIKINPAFVRITGYSAEEALGRTPGALLKSGRHDKDYYREMWDNLTRDGYWQGEIWNRRKNGEIYPVLVHITVVAGDDGEVSNYVASYVDITQKKQAEETIHNLAFYDHLTELPNRRLLQDRLQHTMASSARNRRHGAVLFIDLDRFKELNDTRGHDVGDLLLHAVASRLLACVRGDDTVARLGGDEFVIILNGLHEKSNEAAVEAENVAEKIRAELSRKFDLEGYEYHTSPSIGITLFVGKETGIDELLKRADTAMFQAKQSGRNAIRFFDPQTHAAMERRIALEADLRKAVKEQQFSLCFQMQVRQDGSVLGAEVLLRWQHPQQGMVSPLDFIPLAEETGLILPIGNWVLDAACQQIKAWQGDSRTAQLQLAVNVSARQFYQDDFVEQVEAVLENTGISPDKLKLELTESVVLSHVDDTIAKMQALKQRGVSFSMDDFGTGHSSLAYLTQLPLDQLKIDQSFVRNIGIKPTDAVIVQTIIGMARNLNMEVIAEGVETAEQRDFLARWGCTNYQGYLYGKPVQVAEFEAVLAQHG